MKTLSVSFPCIALIALCSFSTKDSRSAKFAPTVTSCTGSYVGGGTPSIIFTIGTSSAPSSTEQYYMNITYNVGVGGPKAMVSYFLIEVPAGKTSGAAQYFIPNPPYGFTSVVSYNVGLVYP